MMIAFDYENDTASTSSMNCTASALVKRPVIGVAVGVSEDWFLLGDSTGRVLQYGKTDVAQPQWNNALAIFHRAGESYDSILQGGLWGAGFNETDLDYYLPELSSSDGEADATMRLTIYGFLNAKRAGSKDNPPIPVVNLDLTQPSNFNGVATHLLAFYFQDRLTVSGTNNPCRLSARTVEASVIGSRSAGRTLRTQPGPGLTPKPGFLH